MNELEKVIKLTSLGLWKEASEYCDLECYKLVMLDDDILWFDVSCITFDENVECWVTYSWGDLACLIYYGENYPRRYKEIDRLKIVVMYLAWKTLYENL